MKSAIHLLESGISRGHLSAAENLLRRGGIQVRKMAPIYETPQFPSVEFGEDPLFESKNSIPGQNFITAVWTAMEHPAAELNGILEKDGIRVLALEDAHHVRQLSPADLLSGLKDFPESARVQARIQKLGRLLPHLIGIVNLNPDSFSDKEPDRDWRARAERLVLEGAEIIDFGAESTSPGRAEMAAAECIGLFAEALLWRNHRRDRGEPVPWISFEARHPETLRWCVKSGAEFINDISSASDSDKGGWLRAFDGYWILMHRLGLPVDPRESLDPKTDPVEFLSRWWADQLQKLQVTAAELPRLIFDPGLSFGKNFYLNWRLIWRLADLQKSVGASVLIGHSRKSFLRAVNPGETRERDLETVLMSSAMGTEGAARFLRVHNVGYHTRAWRVLNFMGGPR